MQRSIFIALFFLVTLNSHAWNMQGHRVVAQIAFDNLTPNAKKMCSKYLSSHSKKSLNANFINAATWMDVIKFKNHEYDAFHYIDIPFSKDGSVLTLVKNNNVVGGINNAISILSTESETISNKRLALLILIHLIGDIHQPLHAITRVSHQLPAGDLGGNLFPLGNNNVARNLHGYWDNGAGFFMGHSRAPSINLKSRLLENKWPCTSFKAHSNPEKWAKHSHRLAIKHAYKINPKDIPDKQYQLNAQKIIQKQTAAAGCQLAALLNSFTQ